VSAPTPTPPPAPKRGPGRPRSSESGGPQRVRPKQRQRSIRLVGKKASPEACKLAAAVLEVLGGARTTGDAAKALGYALPRYYHLEARAIEGLVAACEPAKPGRTVSPSREVEALKRRCARLEREVGRHQALVRAAHRTVGLVGPASVKPQPGKKRAKRPTARALVVASILSAAPPASETPQPPSGSPSA